MGFVQDDSHPSVRVQWATAGPVCTKCVIRCENYIKIAKPVRGILAFRSMINEQLQACRLDMSAAVRGAVPRWGGNCGRMGTFLSAVAIRILLCCVSLSP